ncbi:VOC family protein [Desertifilum sp. FACHB-1129]|uniref:Glyoxalase-like domain-containing protein n=2 Tax=Desertifilum tharense IPPAS B-1220 TaxID=1781255 RepID=A0A1E5QE95_9CYAN|nr:MULTISPECIES: VOC family protein [Desertifilum]MDA0213572.1 VOC family protein [Cyanobacteria bacterium FC1]MBD2315038.1 VOC family protein [Desertifilum sp. FACHB-1129]MBD2325176.1 VOC family protein [Desertifilum sp. FACHB-866]MBD2335258.1 VOC family protein [Desertifilum sp. FACHB-868]OEJ72978.1 hypothetical protein BH720_22180 [Desertifilum tharense IPPAS B-1220]
MEYPNLPLELDHVLIWVQPSAPEIAKLEAMGLQPTSRTASHQGQGTASRFFFFANAYLELIWLADEAVAQQNTERTAIDWRSRAAWQQTGASPFGVGFRCDRDSVELRHFPHPYWAEWMSPQTSIYFANSATQALEPLWFVVPEYMAFATQFQQYPDDLQTLAESHPLGVRKVTDVKITGIHQSHLAFLSHQTIVTATTGSFPLLEITFDCASQGKILDARPQLPLIVHC